MGLPEILGGNKKYISIICFTINVIRPLFHRYLPIRLRKDSSIGRNWNSPATLAAPKNGYVGGIYKVGPAYDRFEMELITLINGLVHAHRMDGNGILTYIFC